MKQGLSKVICAIGILALLLSMTTGCEKVEIVGERKNSTSYESLKKDFDVEKNAKLVVWYQNEAEEQFLLEAAEGFEEKYSMEIQCCYIKKTDYL